MQGRCHSNLSRNQGGCAICAGLAATPRSAICASRAGGFTGNATRMNEADTGKLFASVDVYEHDFGTLKIVPDPVRGFKLPLVGNRLIR